MKRTPFHTEPSTPLSFAWAPHGSSALRRATPQPLRAWLAVAALPAPCCPVRCVSMPSTRLPMPQQLVALADVSADVRTHGTPRARAVEPADAARRCTATYAMHQPLDQWGQRHAETVRTATVQGAVR